MQVYKDWAYLYRFDEAIGDDHRTWHTKHKGAEHHHHADSIRFEPSSSSQARHGLDQPQVIHDPCIPARSTCACTDETHTRMCTNARTHAHTHANLQKEERSVDFVGTDSTYNISDKYASVHTCTCTCLCKCTCTCTCTSVCAHKRMHARAHISTQTFMCAHVHTGH